MRLVRGPQAPLTASDRNAARAAPARGGRCQAPESGSAAGADARGGAGAACAFPPLCLGGGTLRGAPVPQLRRRSALSRAPRVMLCPAWCPSPEQPQAPGGAAGRSDGPEPSGGQVRPRRTGVGAPPGVGAGRGGRLLGAGTQVGALQLRAQGGLAAALRDVSRGGGEAPELDELVLVGDGRRVRGVGDKKGGGGSFTGLPLGQQAHALCPPEPAGKGTFSVPGKRLTSR